MSSILASTSRLPAIHPSFTRSVIHRARPPLRPSYPDPLTPTRISSSPGTSRPNPSHLPHPSTLTKHSTSLPDSGLEFHHAPPPTAPSYTTGAVPDLLRWVAGQEVRRSGQAGAPVVRARRDSDREGLVLGEGVAEQIRELRLESPRKWTRKALMRKFDIPASKSIHLARLAPTPKAHRISLEQVLEKKKESWGFTTRVSREVRELRKGFW